VKFTKSPTPALFQQFKNEDVMSIPFIDLAAQQTRLKSDIDARMAAVLAHGKYIMGPEIAELEKELSAFSGAKHSISVSSGTDALLVALMADGIGRGDAVFLPAFTFTATAEVVIIAGATPVFVDVDPSTCNMDYADLKRRIENVEKTGDLRPRAIMPVDLFGLPADYSQLADIAAKHDMLIIADAAQSFGGAIDNKPVGSLAPISATSFFPAKPLGCYGDGGAVFTDDDERADRWKSIRAHGKGGAKYDIIRIGLNARLDTLQAAILLSKLTIFGEEIESRERISRLYDERLSNHVGLPHRQPGFQSAWAQYTIQVENRDEIANSLKEEGIPSAIYYPLPMHLQTAYAKYGEGQGSLPVSERLSGRVLSLPMHPYLSEKDIDTISEKLIACVRQAG
jgi:UDP-2-acetamido-2-deoxy-ribo-hexuluronate aminotransferase